MRNRLCKEIESAIGQRLRTPKDFDYLRKCIYARLRIIVSSTTLKRLWGYLNDGGEPREATLTTLCRFWVTEIGKILSNHKVRLKNYRVRLFSADD